MVKSFDIGPSRKKKRKKENYSKTSKKSNSWISWIFLIIVIFIASSFLTTNSNTNHNELPKSSINNEVLAEKVENNEESKITPQVTLDQESPNKASEDLSKSVSEAKEEDKIFSDNINNQTIDSINKLELKIKILNATGEPKQAAKAKDDLEKKGYVIAKIDTAKNVYKTSYIYYSDSQFESSQQINQDIKINAILEQNKNITSNFDLVIVIGKNYIK